MGQYNFIFMNYLLNILTRMKNLIVLKVDIFYLLMPFYGLFLIN